MFWLSRPPYWRWLGAVLIVAAALYLDLTGPPTESYPFVAEPAGPGEALQVEWRVVPTGLLPDPGPLPAIAWRAVDAGVPLVPGAAGHAPPAPEDWWALEIDLPASAGMGEAVLVAVHDPATEVAGIVVQPSTRAGFGSATPGMIAVPAEHAATVAVAVAENRATVLVRP
jgi:hypothetical protein